MRSKDRGPGIRSPQGQLMISMLYFPGTDEYLDTGWDRDPIVFNLGGGCRQTHRQRPQGACHQRLLQPQWWMLSHPSVEPPRGQPLTLSSTSVVDVVRPTDSAP
jgi:hypothetical protein